MKSVLKHDIEIISAPSILGLTPSGVEELGKSLLAHGLAEKLATGFSVTEIKTLNHFYNDQRDSETKCLNPQAIRDFSLTLGKAVSEVMRRNRFPFVTGGDCSILIGIMQALKAKGNHGLLFLDAHADFYLPEQSPTGEVADMDLAIVTGRGPDMLTNMNNLKPYVNDADVVHIGQRDEEETKKYRSQDISDTAIKCVSLAEIKSRGLPAALADVLQYVASRDADGFWIHYDTDVLADDINPAVDYRLPGGLQFEQIEDILRSLLLTGRMSGLSLTIFNPRLDASGRVAQNLVESLGRTFKEEID